MRVPLLMENGSYEIKFGPANLETPYRARNCLTRDRYGRYHLSNQMDQIRDISHCHIRRPSELGQLISWELEEQIWDYCLFNPDEFGWELKDSKDVDLIASETCMTIPEISKNMDQVVFEEYEFGSMMKCPVAQFVPFDRARDYDIVGGAGEVVEAKSGYNNFQLVVDSGFNCTWVMPVIKGVPYYKATKKLDIGGRFLNGLLKETISFRHYNVMDETILINNIKEQCCFMPPVSYFDSFQRKEETRVEYILPDFQTSLIGYVRQPKQAIPKTSQILRLEDELFTVPETFFHPEISNILKPGLVETILECVSMVPEVLRPLLVSNIVAVGGNFNIANFATRLATELQRQCPTDWKVRVHQPKLDAALQGWKSMRQFSQTDSYKNSRVTRSEYLEHGADWCTKHRFGYEQWI
ncbi:AGR091Wp [Eremothecium gossypii ATCC 10895]|uniref:Actin-like protein ARP6 n=1 Tax=Eremothecium gossypii (strain ATCC 10895 / CBS 109.51 / FGSC 9923 / NRRL Y-1056) TaxID=284811 RepID=ARP6_EREGS|nr:AGR091Wp [Eremothecium gossypii ATCC 10895]Q74ZV8.1 RecName: Full=Actin-like protein ARP6 [Eremothecium gossypii ATCC 10895]AAS54580.1 AGR091Wp [Eremothecium gossypii ATCC 10895]AEY98912.1 FAGR091Wp [Eremothecium gossypii FDAG1]